MTLCRRFLHWTHVFQQRNKSFQGPDVVCDSGFHRGSDAQASDAPGKIVIREVERDRVKVVLKKQQTAVNAAIRES